MIARYSKPCATLAEEKHTPQSRGFLEGFLEEMNLELILEE